MNLNLFIKNKTTQLNLSSNYIIRLFNTKNYNNLKIYLNIGIIYLGFINFSNEFYILNNMILSILYWGKV